MQLEEMLAKWLKGIISVCLYIDGDDTSLEWMKANLSETLSSRIHSTVVLQGAHASLDDQFLIVTFDITHYSHNEYGVVNIPELKRLFREEIQSILDAGSPTQATVERVQVDFDAYADEDCGR